jgi:hypothetical protein
MTINIGLVIAILASVGINAFAIWYIRDILGRLTWISRNVNDISELAKAYRNHVKSIYNLENFYGDKEIKLLLEHTTLFLEELEEYESVVLELEPVEITQEKEEINNAEKEEDDIQKDVLYAGTRRRDS